MPQPVLSTITKSFDGRTVMDGIQTSPLQSDHRVAVTSTIEIYASPVMPYAVMPYAVKPYAGNPFEDGGLIQLAIPNMTWEELREALLAEGILPDAQVERAVEFAVLHHGTQSRLGGGSVLEEHVFPVCADVMCRTRDESVDSRRVLAVVALLHDVVEDCRVSLEEIEAAFGDTVAHLIDLMTETGKSAEEYFGAIAKSRHAALVKVCDRRNNLCSFGKVPDRALLAPYCVETEQFLIPIAGALSDDELTELRDGIRALIASVEAESGEPKKN